jgi:hypothetical protein
MSRSIGARVIEHIARIPVRSPPWSAPIKAAEGWNYCGQVQNCVVGLLVAQRA